MFPSVLLALLSVALLADPPEPSFDASGRLDRRIRTEDEARAAKTVREWRAQALTAKSKDNRIEAAVIILRIAREYAYELGKPERDPLISKQCRTAAIELLKSRDNAVRACGLDALWEIGDHECQGAVAPLLYDDNKVLGQHAARTLGRVGDDRSVAALKQAGLDDDLFVWETSAWALMKIGTPQARKALNELHARFGNAREFIVKVVDYLEGQGPEPTMPVCLGFSE
ncbi:MAG: HEAT repeat domain-containing protein [Pirellulales bacterium]